MPNTEIKYTYEDLQKAIDVGDASGNFLTRYKYEKYDNKWAIDVLEYFHENPEIAKKLVLEYSEHMMWCIGWSYSLLKTREEETERKYPD